MAIKVTLDNGSIIEGTADELAEYLRLAKEVMEEKDEPTSAKVYDKPAQVGDTIRITDAHILNKGRDYNNGDVMTVEHIEVDLVESRGIVYKTNKYRGFINEEEYEIIGRGLEEEEFEDSPEITVGKRYELTKDGVHGDIKKGERVIVTNHHIARDEYRVNRVDARCRNFDYVNAEDLTEIKPGEGDIVSFERSDGVSGLGVVEDIARTAIGVRTGKETSLSKSYYGVMEKDGDTFTIVALKEERSDV